jgi:hydroxymethylpyrimidine/phosphomethylpyrimidine kinase
LKKIALSVAGSDSSAGAGIQADLKTFAALGVYGCTAVTAITSQTGSGVSGITPTPPKMIETQIRTILNDISPDAIKIGMVYCKKTINSIRKSLEGSKIPMILDPVMIAGTGEPLLDPNAIADFSSNLLPLATIVTPNIFEAEALSGLKITSIQSAVDAAQKIREMGPNNVVLKGGHLSGRTATDVIVDTKNQIFKISNRRLKYDRMHGGGCTFSASLTAFVARNFPTIYACKMANQFTHISLNNRINVAPNLIVSSPLTRLYDSAERYEVYIALRRAINVIESTPYFGKLIPETQSNLGYSITEPKDCSDVMAADGRIVKVGNNARLASDLGFGASKHVAAAILTHMSFNPFMRSAMNIKYDSKIISIASKIFVVANYDRTEEPKKIKKREGHSISWGVIQALNNTPNADVIYHKGDFGKEAMTLVFAPTPIEVIKKIIRILKDY